MKLDDLTIIKKNKKKYLCQCVCGNTVERSEEYLKRIDRYKSCGCIKKRRGFERFKSLFQKSENCWVWKGKLNSSGYGKFRGLSASRASYEYYIGKIPQKMQVCHTCDNRKCVNPNHLFLGSISDNMRDRDAKKRQAKGSKIKSSILDEKLVLNIRKDRLNNLTYSQLSEKYNISFYLVRSVCKNRQWKHVDLGKECSAYVSIHDKNKKQHGV